MSKTKSIYLPSRVDRKHLMRFQSGDAVFKFLLPSVGRALENVNFFTYLQFSDQTSHSRTPRGAKTLALAKKKPNNSERLKERFQGGLKNTEVEVERVDGINLLQTCF